MVALLAFLASSGSSAASSGTAAAPAAGHCGPAAAARLASSPEARVYSWHGAVFGCAFAESHQFRLGSAARSIREARVSPVAVAGVNAAYGLSNFGVDTIRASVVVRRLTDGTQLKELAATRAVGAESFESVGSVVVRPDGAVAWIGSLHSIIGHRSVTEVHEASSAGDRVLDSGLGIDSTSLRVRGDTLSWVNSGVTRHATLY